MDLLSDLADEHVSLNSSILRSIDKEGLTLETSIEAENKKFALARYLDAYKNVIPTIARRYLGYRNSTTTNMLEVWNRRRHRPENQTESPRQPFYRSVKSNDLADNFLFCTESERKQHISRNHGNYAFLGILRKEKVYVGWQRHQRAKDCRKLVYLTPLRVLRAPSFFNVSWKLWHLQMISFGGTLGVGLYLNSGKAFATAGGFWNSFGFCHWGVDCFVATIISFCEMVEAGARKTT